MSENKNRIHNISLRLSDEELKQLESVSESHGIAKSTMATNIIVNALMENLDEFLINHISYPRPILKKLFSLLDNDQINQMIMDINEYNQGIIQSSLHTNTPKKIINLLKKWMKKSGCEVSETTFQLVKILEVHHELEKNWSTITCVTMAFIIGELGFEIKRTFTAENWFKIEYF